MPSNHCYLVPMDTDDPLMDCEIRLCNLLEGGTKVADRSYGTYIVDNNWVELHRSVFLDSLELIRVACQAKRQEYLDGKLGARRLTDGERAEQEAEAQCLKDHNI